MDYVDVDDLGDINEQLRPCDVKDLKSFTKFCKLSTPTIKKWLEGGVVYKSSTRKIMRAMKLCNLTKDKLMSMRRKSKIKNKVESTFTLFDGDTGCLFPSINGFISRVLYHSTNNLNELEYTCEDFNNQITRVSSTECLCYDDIKKIKTYWESKLF